MIDRWRAAQSEFGLAARDALTLIDEPTALAYFLEVLDFGAEPRSAANWCAPACRAARSLSRRRRRRARAGL